MAYQASLRKDGEYNTYLDTNSLSLLRKNYRTEKLTSQVRISKCLESTLLTGKSQICHQKEMPLYDKGSLILLLIRTRGNLQSTTFLKEFYKRE